MPRSRRLDRRLDQLTHIAHRSIRTAFLIALAMALVRSVALAQSPSAPSSHHTIRLTSQKITLPLGNSVFAGGDTARLANSRCLLCHSKEMIDTQPPLSLDVWKKEIDKMRTAYGCPLGADQTAALAEFIAQAAGKSTSGPAK